MVRRDAVILGGVGITRPRELADTSKDGAYTARGKLGRRVPVRWHQGLQRYLMPAEYNAANKGFTREWDEYTDVRPV